MVATQFVALEMRNQKQHNTSTTYSVAHRR